MTRAAASKPAPVWAAAWAAALWASLALWAATITWLSSLPPWALPTITMRWDDKLAHFAAFAAGGWLAAKAVKTSFPSPGTRTGLLAMSAILIAASFGIFDELFQLRTPGRHGADLRDWVADLLGASAGVGLATLLTRRAVPGWPKPARNP